MRTRLFDLTVPEQRAIICLLAIVLAFAVAKAYRPEQRSGPPAAAVQPSPSPGILP